MSERDKTRFRNIYDLHREVNRFGYYSGLRLLKATMKRFAEWCEKRCIVLPNRNFTVRYASNIPRHVGLAGSSAIITAFLRAMAEFYELTIPLVEQPTLVLAVETDELGISAGLQDRVIQAYEGVVYMDFRRDLVESTGHGDYEQLSPDLLPPLFIAYRTDLQEGSEVFHNNIRMRFNSGDPAVVDAMQRFAELARLSREALVSGQPNRIGHYMDENFDLRASIYPISERNRQMVRIGRDLGAHVKFSGSGGAIIGTFDDHEMFPALEKAYVDAGFKIFRPRIV